MSITLSRKERKIKFKSLAFAALQKSTGDETICVQVGAHVGKTLGSCFWSHYAKRLECAGDRASSDFFSKD